MSFATYWDLEPKTRAALSEADVQRYLDAELMTKGVLKVEEYLLEVEPEVPPLERAIWYRVAGFDPVFATAELAQKFIDLQPRATDTKRIGSDWRSQESIEHIEPAKPLEVTTVSLASEVAIEQQRGLFEKRAAVRASNRTKVETYEKAIKVQNEALSGLWEDWHARRREAAQHRKVVDTYAAYVQTAGDHDVAAKFLLKVFSEEQIKDASDWTGVTINTKFVADETPPEPGPSHPEAPAPKNDDAGIPF